MLVDVICLLKAYGFFEEKEQEEVYAFIKKLNAICRDCRKCGEESTQEHKGQH